MIPELERFLAIISEGSYTKAAKKVYLTQPALSASIVRLEEELGVKLFKRTGKRFVLTADGEAVSLIGAQILKLWSKIKDPTFRNQSSKPLYSIGLYDNAALRLSKYFQKKLSEADFRFEITINRSETLMQRMINGLDDLCVCIIDPLRKEPSLIKIFSEELLPVSSKIWKKDCKNIPYILYNKGSVTRTYIDETFVINGISPNIIVESTSTNFMKELAVGGCGVALLPENFINRELLQKKLFVQKLPFKFERKIGLFLNKEGSLKETDQVVEDIKRVLSN